ncbi:MAG: N-acetyltransferase family protein [Methanobacterium sp.]
MIRKASIKDMNSIIDLWEGMMNFHIEKSDLYLMKPNARNIYTDYLKNVLRNPDYIKLVFESENVVLGYLIATESSDPPVYEGKAGLILELSVNQEHRNKGIGEKLLAEIEKYFKNKDILRTECMVSCFNEVSRGFWSKNGYKPYNMMCVKLLH